MYNEIWKSVEALFKPLHSMSALIAIPELTFDLMGALRLNLDSSEFSDTSKYKRIIKQVMTNPEYQVMNIIFDFEDENAEPKIAKMMYEGKLTLFTITPYRYILNTPIDGPVPSLMLHYLFLMRSMIPSTLTSQFAITQYNKLLNTVSLHSIPLLFTKWMTSIFGVEKEVGKAIVKELQRAEYPAGLTEDHIIIYMDLLMDNSIEKLLDYSFIATEDRIMKEAYIDYVKSGGDSDEKDIQAD